MDLFEMLNFVKNYLHFTLMLNVALTQEEFEDTKVVNQKPYIDEEQTAQWSIGQRTRRV